MPRIIIYSLILTLFFSQQAFAKSPHIYCYKLSYHEMQKHKASKALRQIFDFYSRINCRESATKGARAFSKKQFLMLKEKFLVLHIEKNEFSEYIMHIAIAPKNHPEKIKMWSLTLSKNKFEPSGYEIIEFDEYDFHSKEGKRWPFDLKHRKYWI